MDGGSLQIWKVKLFFNGHQEATARLQKDSGS